MPIAMRILGLADGRVICPETVYLKKVDFIAKGGRGTFEITDKLEEAIHFSSAREALALYNTVSPIKKFRPDNELNKPLTAFVIEIADFVSKKKRYQH